MASKEFTDLQIYQNGSLQMKNCYPSVDWLEFRYKGKFLPNIIRYGREEILKNGKTQHVNFNYFIDRGVRNTPNGIYKNVYEYKHFTFSWGLRGHLKNVSDQDYIHIKISNEYLYKSGYTNPYRYFEEFQYFFENPDARNCYISRMDLCIDMPKDSAEYIYVQKKFELGMVGYGKKRLKTSVGFNETNETIQFEVNEYLAKALQREGEMTYKQFKKFKNVNYAAGCRNNPFYFRFYNKTLELEGTGKQSKKEYISTLHKIVFAQAEEIYRLEVEIKLPRLQISLMPFKATSDEVFGSYFNYVAYNGAIFDPRNLREIDNTYTCDKQQRFLNAMKIYLQNFPDDVFMNVGDLYKKLALRLEGKYCYMKGMEFNEKDALEAIKQKSDALTWQEFIEDESIFKNRNLIKED